MRHPLSSLQNFVAAKRFRSGVDGIEWEELPSLADSLAERLVNSPERRREITQFEGSSGAPWDNTQPADLFTFTPSGPFQETLSGLATREVHEPEVFRHFFGASAA
jgi:hypothetical protein